MSWLTKLLGDPNKREVNKYQELLDAVTALGLTLEKESDAQLRDRSLKLKQQLSERASEAKQAVTDIDDAETQRQQLKKALQEILTPHMAEAFALVREAASRTIGLRHYDVQLVGGAVLHGGQIAEMQTGEGKTLVATLPLYLNALTGFGTHLVTVNDYLARRDAGWMGPVYDFLGLSVGVIAPDISAVFDATFSNDEHDPRLQKLRPVSRQAAYQADITYGTNNEFGFDYLRDNMVQDPLQMVQRPLTYAIVDEVDSILIDEARTPLIISAPASQSAHLYDQFAGYIPKLKAELDFLIDEKARTASLTEEGIKKLEQLIGIHNLYDPQYAGLVHHADVALRAETLYHKNRDYVVKDSQVIIIDEFTGRMLQGRRYSGGLHQAIEAKEKVPVQEESVTLATITFQNYFRLYTKLAGMTGTAITEAEEFSKIYGLEAVSVPTHRAVTRRDLSDEIYKTEAAKFKAVVELVRERQEVGQPVLIGTVSITKSEKLSRLLKAANIKHAVLNAKLHQREGEIVAQAGEIGSVTVATNMAGRGVDIVLGGTPPQPTAPKAAFKDWEMAHQKVLELGGLYVIGTERHESRRIDNQLRGRSGRQGDAGVSQFFVSMEDDLMRIFGGERMKNLMERLNMPDDMSINNRLLTRAIEQAQSKVEGHNFDIRKQLVEYDDVMNRHRQAIYRRRERILRGQTPEQLAALHEETVSALTLEERDQYAAHAKGWSSELRGQIERAVSLRAIDVLWIEHLRNMEALRESIGLRGYGQREPIVEYKQEAFTLFGDLQRNISAQIAQMLIHAQVEQPPALKPESSPYQGAQAVSETAEAKPSKTDDKIGRNDPCPCGAIDPQTGKVYKYKKCGLINAPYHRG